MSTWLLCILFGLATQDRPTTPGSGEKIPELRWRTDAGTAGSLGYDTGRGSQGRSIDDGAALGLVTSARLDGPRHGAMHAIAEIPLEGSGVTTPRDDPDRPRTRSSSRSERRLRSERQLRPGSRTTDRPAPSRDDGHRPGRLVYGFTAVAERSWILHDDGRSPRPDRAELYLYDRGAREDGGERSYHAIIERGRIIEESGERGLLRYFAEVGRDRWLQPFERQTHRAWPPSRGIPRPSDLVGSHLETTVQDLLAARRGRPSRRLSGLTKIERRETRGAVARGSARSQDRDGEWERDRAWECEGDSDDRRRGSDDRDR